MNPKFRSKDDVVVSLMYGIFIRQGYDMIDYKEHATFDTNFYFLWPECIIMISCSTNSFANVNAYSLADSNINK